MQPTARVVVTLPPTAASAALAGEISSVADSCMLLDQQANVLAFVMPFAGEASTLVDWLAAYLDGSAMTGTITYHLCRHATGEAGVENCATVPSFVRVKDGVVVAFGGGG